MADHLQTGQGAAYAGDLRQRAADLGLGLFAVEAATADPGRLEAVLQTAAELEIPIVAIGSGARPGTRRRSARR